MKTAGEQLEQCSRQPRERVHVRKDRVAKSRQIGELIAAMERHTALHADVRLIELGTEVDAFLAIRVPGCEFIPDNKVTAPRATTATHVNPPLLCLIERKERARQAHQPLDQRRVDTVADDVEESKFTTCRIELLGQTVA
jgi:hypothetical protein